MPKKYSYDVKCAELASHFLWDQPNAKPGDTAELAQAVQDAVEAFMRDVDARAKVPA